MQVHDSSEIEITKLLLLPIRSKMDGYGMSAFFVLTKNGWARWHDYDCWDIRVEAGSPTEIKYNLVRGDFEYGGVVFFEFGNEDSKRPYISYGGIVTLK